jgi:hypothetical protein
MLQLLAKNVWRPDKNFVSGHLLVGQQPRIVQFL